MYQEPISHIQEYTTNKSKDENDLDPLLVLLYTNKPSYKSRKPRVLHDE
ncbi:11394_t:CDS:1, partial [Scutellospora calospora]